MHWWRYLPPCVKGYYDPEDMIQEAVLHVVRQKAKYRPTCKESTWVWWVAENKCLSILSHYNSQKLNACVVELESKHSPSIGSIERRRSSVEAIERVIERSSDQVLDLLEKILDGSLRSCRFSSSNGDGQWVLFSMGRLWIGKHGEIRAGDSETVGLVEELRETFRSCSASLDDLRTVMCHAVV